MCGCISQLAMTTAKYTRSLLRQRPTVLEIRVEDWVAPLLRAVVRAVHLGSHALQGKPLTS